MTFTLQQCEEIVLVLENEARFYRQYWNGKLTHRNDTYGKRRAIIGTWLVARSTPWTTPLVQWPAWVNHNSIEDRDQLRRYFDDRYKIPQDEVNKYADIPSVWSNPKELPMPEPNWKDELRAAHARGATLQYLRANGDWADEGTNRIAACLTFSSSRERYRIKPGTDPSTNPSIVEQPQPTPTPTPTPKEPTMAKPIEITTITYANGADISKMSNSEVFDLIASEEAAIEKLKQIKAQPKKLLDEITKREAGIAALVAHLDKAPA